MGNASTTYYTVNGQTLHHITDANVGDDGGESVAIRAITPSRKPIGWRHSQLPSHTISFSVPVLDEIEFDWMAYKESKEEFVFQQISDLWTRSFTYVIVQTCDSATDTETMSETWSVTLGALESKYEA